MPLLLGQRDRGLTKEVTGAQISCGCKRGRWTGFREEVAAREWAILAARDRGLTVGQTARQLSIQWQHGHATLNQR